MSDLLQSGHHPDADQLSAFSEHALPAHEYEQTLAHLAVCPDCRRVVALSMPPVGQAREPNPEVVHKPRFFGWKFALPVAAAIAALAIVLIQIRNTAPMRRGAVTTQEAESRSTSPGQHPETSPAGPPIPPAQPSSNARPNTSRVLPAAPSNSKSATSRSGAAPSNLSEAVKAPTLHGSVTPDGQPSDLVSGGVIGGISNANSAPPPQNPAPGTLHGSLFRAESVTPPAAAPAPAAAMGGSIAPPLAQAHVMPAAPPAPGVADSMLRYSLGVRALTPLPSKLPAISVVSLAHQVLAVDSQNTLFFSGDDGKTWKAVRPQWKGRAVKVALASSVPLAKASGGIMGGIGTSTASFDPSAAPVRTRSQAAGSTLAGRVTDPSGAVIANADVVATGQETLDSRTVKTDNTGGYVIPHLAPGNYQIAARAPGFQEQVSTVNVAASETRLANFTLQIGSASQTVTVAAEANSIPLAESPVSANKITGPPVTRPPLPIFEMTTEDGAQWTSADGQTWKRK